MSHAKAAEPSCRVCGCTEHSACDEGCSWVRVEPGSAPLCSACSGQADDMAEVLIRVKAIASDNPRKLTPIISAAIMRRADRKRLEAHNQDPSWGGR
jgi:hypothetical protein